MSFIEVENISKTFKVAKKESGFKNSIKSFFKREYRYVNAIKDISFSIEKGEIDINLYVDVEDFDSAISRTTVELVPELIISADSNLHQLSSTRIRQGEYVFILYRTDMDVMMQIKITLPISTISLRVS